MSWNLKLNDLLELSKVYAPEYNMPELHDRVLVFDVMHDGWEAKAILDIASNEDGDHSVNVEETSGMNTTAVSNEIAQESVDNEEGSNSESDASVMEASNVIKPEVEAEGDNNTGSISEQDSSTFLSNGLQNDEVNNTESILRQHRIFVHSSWLAVQSKYFRSLFYSGMKESSIKEVHVKVSESEEATHLKLLEAIYKADILNGATVAELLAVLELADKYDVKFVFKKCKYVLQTRVTTVDICKQVMHVIKEKHSFADVEDLAATMQIAMGGNFTPLEDHWQTENFTSLTKPFVQYLLASTDLKTYSENTVFQALMHWMEVNNVDPASLEKDSGLLKSVRFEKISIDYLYNVVRVHPIAGKMPGFQDLMLQGMTYHALPPELKQRVGEVTPRQRQNVAGGVAQYTWTISKAQLFTHNSTFISSEEFWICGYKAKMQLQYYDVRYSNDYNVRVYLSFLGLTNRSHVPLKWRISGVFTTVNGSGNFSSYPTSISVNIAFLKANVGETTNICLIVDEH